MSLSGLASLHQAQQPFLNALKYKDCEALQEILSVDFIARSSHQPNSLTRLQASARRYSPLPLTISRSTSGESWALLPEYNLQRSNCQMDS